MDTARQKSLLDEEADDSNKQDAPHPDADGADPAVVKTEKGAQSRKRRSTAFPPAPFEEALELAQAIQKHASGQRVRRLRLFELIGRSPESSTSRNIITVSARYCLTTGGQSAEWLELTADGRIATAENVPEREKIRAKYKLAIEQFVPFKRLHDQFVNNRLPAKSILSDFLRDEGIVTNEVSECVDIFLLNAKYIGILQNISGAERLVPLDYVLDYAPAGVRPTSTERNGAKLHSPPAFETPVDALPTSEHKDWDKVCFYITPIGDDGSEQRSHSDLFLGSIIEPALEEFRLDVVRADKIAEAGLISRQIIEHILRARLVIVDLSFSNPNVFYELALRHASGLPTVQVIRTCDRIPFDVNQVRTIQIDTSSIYALVPQLEVYRTAIASQVRRALESPDSVDSPVSAFTTYFKSLRQSVNAGRLHSDSEG